MVWNCLCSWADATVSVSVTLRLRQVVIFSAFAMATCTFGGKSSRLPSTFKRTPCRSSISLCHGSVNELGKYEQNTNVPTLRDLDDLLLKKLHEHVHLLFGSVEVID